jgi:hypothetical protein
MAIRRRAEIRLRDDRLAGQIRCKPLAGTPCPKSQIRNKHNNSGQDLG